MTTVEFRSTNSLLIVLHSNSSICHILSTLRLCRKCWKAFVASVCLLHRVRWNLRQRFKYEGYYEPRHYKTNKMSVRPAKTQISLGIRPVWSESSLCAQWVAKDPRFLHADSEDSDQTGQMPRLICVFAGRTHTLLVLSCRGSLLFIASAFLFFSFFFSSQKHFETWNYASQPDPLSWSESSLGAHTLCWFCHVAAPILFIASSFFLFFSPPPFFFFFSQKPLWNVELCITTRPTVHGLTVATKDGKSRHL